VSPSAEGQDESAAARGLDPMVRMRSSLPRRPPAGRQADEPVEGELRKSRRLGRARGQALRRTRARPGLRHQALVPSQGAHRCSCGCPRFLRAASQSDQRPWPRREAEVRRIPGYRSRHQPVGAPRGSRRRRSEVGSSEGLGRTLADRLDVMAVEVKSRMRQSSSVRRLLADRVIRCPCRRQQAQPHGRLLRSRASARRRPGGTLGMALRPQHRLA
jgi:hypothetical protein